MPLKLSDELKRKGFQLSLDSWAVLLGLALAAAVRFHILKAIPW